MTQHPALAAGRVAVVTGGASGIGLAAAKRFAGFGMRVCIVDVQEETLAKARAEIAGVAASGEADVLSVALDVSDAEAVGALKTQVYERFGEVAVLMNNAGVGRGGGAWERADRWKRLMDVNLWGVINGLQAFVPSMLAQATPCAIVNTGSKQGITNPPGDAAYNVTKAAVKSLTESLAHQLRNTDGGRISAHLLIPGSTFTGMSAPSAEKPAGAWTGDQVADELVAGMGRGDFYILCPDNDVTRAMDEKRSQWMVNDLILNRPALSRWHPDYKVAFEAFMAS
jgi:NAD(P)-dependent dehydrogenase (short-subunit alcohol dehydrogenase family)